MIQLDVGRVVANFRHAGAVDATAERLIEMGGVTLDDVQRGLIPTTVVRNPPDTLIAGLCMALDAYPHELFVVRR